MSYKTYVFKLLFLGIFITTAPLCFAGKTPDTQSNSGKDLASAINYTPPSGNWQDIPQKSSLVPYYTFKRSEKLETDKKVTVVFGLAPSSVQVLSLLDSVENDLKAKWSHISRMTGPRRTENSVELGDMQFHSIYQATDIDSGVLFRIEVVVSSAWKRKGTRGILYIITPVSRYFKNRFFIADIRKALKRQ